MVCISWLVSCKNVIVLWWVILILVTVLAVQIEEIEAEDAMISHYSDLQAFHHQDELWNATASQPDPVQIHFRCI